MGKGSNVQKAQAARERNQKKMGKSEEERKAASAKSAKDANAFVCGVCRQNFMVNATKAILYQHCTAKHDGIDPLQCFALLADFDPNDPKGLKKAASEAEKKTVIKKKVTKKADDDLDALLSAGLTKGKKK